MNGFVVVFAFHDGGTAIAVAGRHIMGAIEPGNFLDDGGMPEPNGPGIWAWVDQGSEPSIDPELGFADDITWRGEWRRLTPEELARLGEGGQP